ncbi:MAG: hypothetical protein KKE20_07090 [Nanoarchaeota archaeon]|nr:hypothetical protein [Nanoarchaeota archaeon]
MISFRELKDLNPRSADIGSITIIRVLKQRYNIPISADSVKESFSDFLIKESDIHLMEQAIDTIPSAMQDITDFSRISQNAERVNLKRAYSGLQEIQEHLTANLDYSRKILAWQESSFSQIAMLVNKIPSLKTVEDKRLFNQEISPVFEMILRNDQFGFMFWDIIHEAQIERIKGIVQGMEEGIFFHTGIEDHLKRLSFSQIRSKLPKEELDIADRISSKALLIKQGVYTAYDANKRMMGYALQFYSYIKWLGGF